MTKLKNYLKAAPLGPATTSFTRQNARSFAGKNHTLSRRATSQPAHDTPEIGAKTYPKRDRLAQKKPDRPIGVERSGSLYLSGRRRGLFEDRKRRNAIHQQRQVAKFAKAETLAVLGPSQPAGNPPNRVGRAVFKRQVHRIQ